MAEWLMVEVEWLLSLLPESYGPWCPDTIEDALEHVDNFTMDSREVIKPLPASAQFAEEMEKDLRLLDALAIKYCPQVYLNTVIKAGVDELLSDIAAAKEVTE